MRVSQRALQATVLLPAIFSEIRTFSEIRYGPLQSDMFLSALGGGLWLADLIPVCRRVSDRWVICLLAVWR